MNITGFVKKRLFLIGCIGVTLAGLGIFAAGLLIASSNAKSLNDIEKTCQAVTPLNSKLVYENELEQLEQNAKLARDDQEAVLALVQATTERSLLSQDVFPRPRDRITTNSLYKQFAENYTGFLTQLRQMIGAGERPTQTEQDTALEQLTRSDGASANWASSTINPAGRSGRFGGTASATDLQSLRLIVELRQRKAKSMKVYAPSEAFCCYTYWRGQPEAASMKKMIKESWFTQLAAWIQEDVALAIMQMNAESPNVLTSPIKRLMAVQFSGQTPTGQATRAVSSSTPSRMTRTEGEASELLPEYYDEAAAAGDIKKAYTGRLGNDLIDVVHFDVIVVMEDSRIGDFINALQGPKYTSRENYPRAQITVLGLNVESIDLESHAADGYYYGPGALKRVLLPCEYFFFKKGYQRFKPREVIEEEEAAAAQPGRSSGAAKPKPKTNKSKDDDLGL